jgi:hypothetical protein
MIAQRPQFLACMKCVEQSKVSYSISVDSSEVWAMSLHLFLSCFLYSGTISSETTNRLLYIQIEYLMLVGQNLIVYATFRFASFNSFTSGLFFTACHHFFFSGEVYDRPREWHRNVIRVILSRDVFRRRWHILPSFLVGWVSRCPSPSAPSLWLLVSSMHSKVVEMTVERTDIKVIS